VTDTDPGFHVGQEVTGPYRTVTPERLRWYGDGMLTAAAGQITLVGSNIHTDAEYAREQGLAEPIADGMIATNWISSLLLLRFGEAYLSAGELRTKFIRPTSIGARVRAGFRIRERIGCEGAVRYQLDVWTEDADGAKLTDGAATVELPVAD
jgi:hypothetical protein